MRFTRLLMAGGMATTLGTALCVSAARAQEQVESNMKKAAGPQFTPVSDEMLKNARSDGGKNCQRPGPGLSLDALMCAGVAMFPFMHAAVKLLCVHYPVAQIVWARFTVHLLVMLIVFLPRYGLRLLATRRPCVQIARSLLMLVSNLVFVFAFAREPPGSALAIAANSGSRPTFG